MKYTPREHHMEFVTDYIGKRVVVAVPYNWIQAMAAKAANNKSGKATQSANRTGCDPIVAKVAK